MPPTCPLSVVRCRFTHYALRTTHYALRFTFYILTQCSHKPIDSIERSLNLIHRRGVTGAHETGAAWSEGVAGYHGNLLLVEQPLGKLLATQAQVPNLGEN